MNTKPNKHYLDNDFFLDENSKNVFEGKSSKSTKHICVTDLAKEIIVLEDNRKLLNTTKGTELVIGLKYNIPLWNQNVTLKWKFNSAFDDYTNSTEVKQYIRTIFTNAINEWGDASPVIFQEDNNQWDFDITILPDNCNQSGCTLASAFFPNEDKNILILHPKMFEQTKKEQIETLIHEIGHIFGLRHYFAKEKESSWRSEVFGVHYPLTIMNYGNYSTLTEQDRTDLKLLYQKVWNGQLTNINGLAIKLFSSSTKVNNTPG